MTTTILQGHVLDVLAGMKPKSVHTVVTSPPYWQLRAYGTPPQAWPDGWVGELGQEPRLEDFVGHLVDVFEATKRVLRDDGTLWVNLGDSYYSNPGGQNGPGGALSEKAKDARRGQGRVDRTGTDNGLKPGDLCMVPARFALAMQQRGWTLRSEITLCKTSPMPESVGGSRWERCKVKTAEGKSPDRNLRPELRRDNYGQQATAETKFPAAAEWADCPGCPRCAATEGYVQRWGSGRPTQATEKLFLFSKAGARYFYDLEATRLPLSQATVEDGRMERGQRGTKGEYGTVDGNAGFNPAGRNAWSWMFWKPEPLQAAHYAAYPRWLPRLAIRAGTSERGCCPGCGAPWLRVVERRPDNTGYAHGPGGKKRDTTPFAPGEKPITGTLAEVARWESTTLGWRQSCSCPPHQPVPATCLDPFSGSGTTVIEANALGRHGIGVELQPKYVEISHKRLSGQPLSLFAQEAAG